MLKGILVGILLILTMGGADAKRHMVTSTPFLGSAGVSGPGYGSSGHSRRQSVGSHHRYHHKRIHRKEHRRIPRIAPESMAGLVTVPTTAGISITVAKNLAPQFQGFVDDLVKLGYTPKHIGCYASGGHVANSNHYHGGACDFDQTGWNRTQNTMYHIGNLASKWGLRDGCSFHRPDCGHIDDGTNIKWKHQNNLIARYIDSQNAPASTKRVTPVLDNFEGGL